MLYRIGITNNCILQKHFRHQRFGYTHHLADFFSQCDCAFYIPSSSSAASSEFGDGHGSALKFLSLIRLLCACSIFFSK